MILRIVCLLVIAFYGSSAQELLMPLVPGYDSLMTDTVHHYLYPVIQENIFLPLSAHTVELPDFNIKEELGLRRNYFISEFPYDRLVAGNFFPLSFDMAYPLFIHNGAILSGANYKLGDRLSVGGFSYGGHSIFSAPFPNRGVNNFDFRGSTLFMQYNISKNFKIGTHISVTRSPGY